LTSILAKTCRNCGKTAKSQLTANLQAAIKIEQLSITDWRQLREEWPGFCPRKRAKAEVFRAPEAMVQVPPRPEAVKPPLSSPGLIRRSKKRQSAFPQAARKPIEALAKQAL
jgi:hypothetical protein